MKSMEIKSELSKSQFNEIKKLYADFFRSIDFNFEYTDETIETFSYKKAKDCFSHNKIGIYYFAIIDKKIVGFIHGKIIDNIGLISHYYVIESYRNGLVSAKLYKKIINWFKENGVSILETEVSKDNVNLNMMERNSWQKVREFDDANIYQKRI